MRTAPPLFVPSLEISDRIADVCRAERTSLEEWRACLQISSHLVAGGETDCDRIVSRVTNLLRLRRSSIVQMALNLERGGTLAQQDLSL